MSVRYDRAQVENTVIRMTGVTMNHTCVVKPRNIMVMCPWVRDVSVVGVPHNGLYMMVRRQVTMMAVRHVDYDYKS